MLNKPAGLITARRDAQRPTIMDLFPDDWRDRFHPVGRLDIDTEGLLIVTDDGKLDNILMQPGKQVEKRYHFRAFGYIGDKEIEKIESGIQLFHTDYTAKPARLQIIGHYKIIDVAGCLPERHRNRYLRNPEGSVSEGIITITEGKKHQVKLMIKSVGCRVFTLKRLSIGGLRLDERLEAGKWRDLTADELELLINQKKCSI